MQSASQEAGYGYEEVEEGEIVDVVPHPTEASRRPPIANAPLRARKDGINDPSPETGDGSRPVRAVPRHAAATAPQPKLITANIKRSHTHAALWRVMYQHSEHLNHIHLGALVVQVGIPRAPGVSPPMSRDAHLLRRLHAGSDHHTEATQATSRAADAAGVAERGVEGAASLVPQGDHCGQVRRPGRRQLRARPRLPGNFPA
eukprot:scaffold8179_cov430-Prasinococcus_capsulatus_cf.AAC.4